MQLTIKNILLVVCFLQTLKFEALVWAKDAAPRSSAEQTTQANSKEESLTAKPNSLENLASSETIDAETTTTVGVESCESGKSNELLESCDCKCANKEQNEAASAEVTTAATSAERTTIADQSAEATEATETPTANKKPGAATTTSSKENRDINQETTPAFTCKTAGNFAHPTDCHRYYNCNPIVNSTNFELIENICPENQAFNTEFSSCMRDLSSCSREQKNFDCLEAGSFADAQSSAASYYRCVPRLGSEATPTYHVFRVNCGAGKIFMPQLGKCFHDLSAPQTGFSSWEYSGLPDDEQLVKAELKQWKLKEKTKLKEEKLKEKYEKKLQKELAKKASKEAKEQAKKEEKSKKGKSSYYDDDD